MRSIAKISFKLLLLLFCLSGCDQDNSDKAAAETQMVETGLMVRDERSGQELTALPRGGYKMFEISCAPNPCELGPPSEFWKDEAVLLVRLDSGAVRLEPRWRQLAEKPEWLVELSQGTILTGFRINLSIKGLPGKAIVSDFRIGATTPASAMKVLAYYLLPTWNFMSDTLLMPQFPIVWGESRSVGIFSNTLEQIFVELELVSSSGDRQTIGFVAAPQFRREISKDPIEGNER